MEDAPTEDPKVTVPLPIIIGWALTALVLLFFVLALWLWPVEQSSGNHSSKWSYLRYASPNEMGDAFAGVASTLALLWLIVTASLQSKELREQKEATKKIATAAEIQNFNSFFFELMSTYNEIVNAMDIRSIEESRELQQGRDCFKTFYRKILDPNQSFETRYPTIEPSGRSIEETLKRYDKMYDQHAPDLGHYFRFTYNMFRAVDESGQADETKRRLLRSLLSDYELVIIFYNSLTKKGEKWARYAESFRLYDNLPKPLLIDRSHQNEVSDESWGDNDT